MSQAIRLSLLRSGARNLQEFGYPSADTKNILTDYVFRKFFVSMLKDNLGKNVAYDEEIRKLLAELK